MDAPRIQTDNIDYSSTGAGEHICYMLAQGFNLSDEDDYRALTTNPNFSCKHCGQQATSDRNLCVPVLLASARLSIRG